MLLKTAMGHFLEKNQKGHEPMTLKEVADAIAKHISTKEPDIISEMYADTLKLIFQPILEGARVDAEPLAQPERTVIEGEITPLQSLRQSQPEKLKTIILAIKDKLASGCDELLKALKLAA